MLPEERTDNEGRAAIRDLESWIASRCLWTIPFLFAIGWLVAGVYSKSLLFLQSPSSFSAALTNPVAIAGGIFLATIPAVWIASVRISNQPPRRFRGVIDAACVLFITLVAGLLIGQAKSLFIIEEAVKARAPQLDFVRNIAFKQQLLRAPAQPESEDQPRIAIIGSSQINLGIDFQSLKEETLSDDVMSICMPGMVPTQYLALADQVIRQRPSHVVCWVSEFDFFREESLPTVRLRWCINDNNFSDLYASVSRDQRWNNRSELADLAFASISAMWRERSLIECIASRFWWAWDVDAADVDPDEAAIGGKLVDLQQGIQNAKLNIRRTSMVETNFNAFSRFAAKMREAKVQLIVLEGESHPEAMGVYPAEYRTETRRRIESIAAEYRFEYVTSEMRPPFTDQDWRDAVHLNSSGRRQLTNVVAKLINADSSRGSFSE